jgi:hypothetical protein
MSVVQKTAAAAERRRAELLSHRVGDGVELSLFLAPLAVEQ